MPDTATTTTKAKSARKKIDNGVSVGLLPGDFTACQSPLQAIYHGAKDLQDCDCEVTMIRNDDVMLVINYLVDSKSVEAIVPRDLVTFGDEEDEEEASMPDTATHPTLFTEHEPIEAVFRKTKTKYFDCLIVATRNDGRLYKIEYWIEGTPAEEVITTTVPIDKVTVPTAETQQEEPAAPAAAQSRKGWAAGLVWEEIDIAQADLPDAYTSPTQIPGRLNPIIVGEFSADMAEGLWDWTREGSKPKLFWDANLGQYYYGDGHHTAGGTKIANLPSVPCLVTSGTLRDAKRYSFNTANRDTSQPITSPQKRELIRATLIDWEMLSEIRDEIYLDTGKTPKAGDANIPPASRAIEAHHNRLFSYATVEKVWEELLTLPKVVADCPWLSDMGRLGLDGKIQKLKVAKADKPTKKQVTKISPAEEPIDQDDPINRKGNHIGGSESASGGGAAEKSAGGGSGSAAGGTAGSSAAPTDSNPLTPGTIYTGKARFKRITELSEAIALQLSQQIAQEMKLKTPLTEVYDALIANIRTTLQWAVTGDSEG